MNRAKFFAAYFLKVTTAISELDIKKLAAACTILKTAYKARKTIYVVGNGGSVSTASHMMVDLSKTIRGHKGDSKWPGFKIISLTDNAGLITAWANDVGYDKSYSGQLENLGEKGDVLIAISSSGNSANILACVKSAKKLKMKTIGIAGFKGGKLAKATDVALVTNSSEYGPVEDLQLIINHAITNCFYEEFHEEHNH